jgi:hypothetical protein
MESKEYDLSSESIYKYDRKTLDAICRLRKLKVSGNKADLQGRILESLGQGSSELAGEAKSNKKTTPKVSPAKSAVDVSKGVEYDTSPACIYKYDKKTLEAICRIRKLKISGKKEELQTRILESTGQIVEKKEVETPKVKVKKTPTKKITPSSSVLQKLEEKSHTYDIGRNKWNNYEHLETRFVFDPNDKSVYGRQCDDGSVVELVRDDIELCKKYKFAYVIPSNLNKNTDGGDVEIDELADDIEEIVALEESDDELEDFEEDDEVVT